MSKKKVPVRKTLAWGLKKYGRWFRLYMRQVRLTEKELGGRLYTC